MRALILSLTLVLAGLMPANAQQSEIQTIITSQMEAFKQDDFATAFTFAHPNIQGIFQTPENFGRMVAQGYPMVWRPSGVEYLPLREEGGRTFQDVRVTGPKGQKHLLEYSMTQTEKGWRISGVRILESNGLNA